uniref:Uncharacterized protein n=1 Tax=Anguilla anguilla TaxID=7936 RepID=A0A0E9R8U9_ANGAN
MHGFVVCLSVVVGLTVLNRLYTRSQISSLRRRPFSSELAG